MSIPLKARRDFVYAGRRLKAGQDFDAKSNSDARLLKAIGHAEDRQAAAPQTYRTRMMQAETPAPVFAQPAASSDDLDAMDADALHALAGSLGLYVHHRTGPERVRQAIRDHRKSNAE